MACKSTDAAGIMMPDANSHAVLAGAARRLPDATCEDGNAPAPLELNALNAPGVNERVQDMSANIRKIRASACSTLTNAGRYRRRQSRKAAPKASNKARLTGLSAGSYSACHWT